MKYLILLPLVFSVLFAAPLSAEMELAQKAYDASNYEEALQVYEKMEPLAQQKAEVLYNMALCYTKLEELGKANYYLHLALKLDYGNTMYHKLLNEIRPKLYDSFEKEDGFYNYSLLQRFLYLGNHGFWAYSAAFVLLLSISFFAIFLRKNQKSYRALSNLSALFFIVLISLHLAFLQQLYQKDFVIIKNNNVALLDEPTAQGSKIAVLHEGSKLKFIVQKGTFYEVSLPNNEKAFIQKEDVYPTWFE